MTRQRIRNVAQQTGAVLSADFDIDGKYLSFLQGCPACIQHFFRSLLGKVAERRAGIAVDGNTAVAGNKAHNIVRRCRFAAFGKRGHQAVFAVNQNAVFAAFFDFGLLNDIGFINRHRRRLIQCAAGFVDGAVGNFALTDGRIEFVSFFEAEFFRQCLQIRFGEDF